MALLIDGKAIAEAIDLDVAAGAARFTAVSGRAPTLAVVLVGDDPASQVYVRNKVRRTTAAGMGSVEHRLAADTAQESLEAVVAALSADPAVDGILVQLPLPGHLDADAVIDRIDPAKDVDGLTQVSAGRLVLGKPGLRPCTPLGCVMLARRTLGELRGAHVVVIGRSILVGKPAGLLFLAEDCTVSLAHSRTRDLAGLARSADILVPAVGRPRMVQGDWVREGACVIDVGINRVPDPARGAGATRLVGDVDFDAAAARAGSITPVPGGVGPMTIACLLRNTLEAAARRAGLDPAAFVPA
jgi:methylenetetrahydrofolate dehydrogenase (NADP+) / methenyltetrahydrofolate cyclohydrolase